MEKTSRLQQIVLPPYPDRGQRRIIREKKQNILSVPFLDAEFYSWYQIGNKRGKYSRPYTYAVITLESLLILAAFVLFALILRIINIAPDAPLNMLTTQRNNFLLIKNSTENEQLVRSMDQHFYKQYCYLMTGSVWFAVLFIMISIAAIMILTGSESSSKRYSICILHSVMLLATATFILPSLLQTHFRVKIFTSDKFIMDDDFFDAWLIAASYRQQKMSIPDDALVITVFEEKYNCCAVNRSTLFRTQFSTHLIVPFVFSTSQNQESVQNFVDQRWQKCKLRENNAKKIIRCSKLLPNMKDGLQLLHFCHEFIIIISILISLLLGFSNFCKWCLECENEKRHIQNMKYGKAMRSWLQLIKMAKILEPNTAISCTTTADLENNRLALETLQAQCPQSKLPQNLSKKLIIK